MDGEKRRGGGDRAEVDDAINARAIGPGRKKKKNLYRETREIEEWREGREPSVHP